MVAIRLNTKRRTLTYDSLEKELLEYKHRGFSWRRTLTYDSLEKELLEYKHGGFSWRRTGDSSDRCQIF